MKNENGPIAEMRSLLQSLMADESGGRTLGTADYDKLIGLAERAGAQQDAAVSLVGLCGGVRGWERGNAYISAQFVRDWTEAAVLVCDETAPAPTPAPAPVGGWTPGAWESHWAYDDGNGRKGWTVFSPAHSLGVCDIPDSPRAEADAHLIAEAGIVAHETGCTPRQLAEDRAVLAEACGELVRNASPCEMDAGPEMTDVAWSEVERVKAALARVQKGGAA